MSPRSIILGLALQALGAHAFWRMECPVPVGNARLDPIVSPGTTSNHAHIIYGSSGFSQSSEYDQLIAGDCTTCRVTQDKSAYWTPKLYFRDEATGQFEEVPQSGLLAYYFLHHDDITAFPPNFRMIAGDTTRRTFTAGFDPHQPDPETSIWASLGLTSQSQLEQMAVGFNCLNYGKEGERTLSRHFMPDKDFLDANCPNGLRIELMFPSCWVGNNVLDSPDHKSHVAYPNLVMTGDCPEGFPVNLPGLMFETHYQTAAFANRRGSFVAANGDPFGYGMHGDFLCAWEEGILQAAVNTCLSDTGLIDDCPVFNLQSKDTASQCKMNLPALVANEDVAGPMSSLPGNVPITYEDGAVEPVAAVVNKGFQVDPSDNGLPLGGSFEASQIYEDVTPTPPSVPEPYQEPAPPAVTEEPVVVQSEPEPEPEVPVVTETPEPEVPVVTETPEPVEVNDRIFSTQYVTNGNVVTKILWEEEVVYETVILDVTTTVGGVAPTPEANQVRRHLHRHIHRH